MMVLRIGKLKYIWPREARKCGTHVVRREQLGISTAISFRQEEDSRYS